MKRDHVSEHGVVLVVLHPFLRLSMTVAVVLTVAFGLTTQAAYAELTDGLVAYWNFDSDYTSTFGGTAYDGRPVNGWSIDPSGKFGGAARFQRARRQYVVIDAPVIARGRDHTYSAWYHLDVANITGADRYFVLETTGFGGADAYAASYGLRESSGDIGQVYTQWPGGTAASNIAGAARATWHNIVVTYDASSAHHVLYLDGALVRNMASSPILMNTAGLIIGGHRAGTGRNWQGLIDDVGFWDRTLTSGEIAALQNRPIIPGFVEVATVLPGVAASSVAWGDYDNDGDLDLLLTGDTGVGAVSQVYRNDAGSFTDIDANLPGVASSSVAWGDYDNDGDLDLLLTGDTGDTGDGAISQVYRNDAGLFTDIGADLPGVSHGSVAWADWDNDGDFDLLLTGDTGADYITILYRNDAGTFADVEAGLQGVTNSSVAWGDYDNDGDLDLLLVGWAPGWVWVSRLYRNDAGAFVDVGATLQGVDLASVAWGDYDADGDLDILLTGKYLYNDPAGTSRVYRNDGGTFVDIHAGLTGVYNSSAAWGDYDNDGDLDILLTGKTTFTQAVSRIYRNDAGVFTASNNGLQAVASGSAAWADYDNDGDLDVLLTGSTGSASICRIYRNDAASTNTPPAAPAGLAGQQVGDQLILSWSASTDAQTPSSGLTYNVRVGTTADGGDIWSPMASAADGFRRVVQMGNAQQNTSWTLTLAGRTATYWTVQAVDAAFAGSEFAPVQPIGAAVGTPDLAIADADLSHRLVADHWELTATVHNVGDGSSQRTAVRFLDARLGTPIGPDVPISPLAPGATTTCSIVWSRTCGHDQFGVQVDPDATIPESTHSNNSAQYSIAGVAPCQDPSIVEVDAKYGHLDSLGVFGRYIKGIKGSKEQFTAFVFDPDDIVTQVQFVIDGATYLAKMNGQDERGYDKWIVDFDPGTLSKNIKMKVRAFSGQVVVSEDVAGLRVRPWPGWLLQCFNVTTTDSLDGEEVSERNVRFEFINGCPYLTFAGEFKGAPDSSGTGSRANPLNWGESIEPDTPFLGGKKNDFDVGLTLSLSCPLLDGCNWIGKGTIEANAEVLGKKKPGLVKGLQGGGEVTLEFDGENLKRLVFDANSRLLIWNMPEQIIPKPPAPGYIVAGLEITFGFSMDLFLDFALHFMEEDNFDTWEAGFYAGVGVDANIMGTVSIPKLKFAKVQLIVSPQFKYGPNLTWCVGDSCCTAGPCDDEDDWSRPGFHVAGEGSIVIDGRVVASITYKVWKYKRTKSWEVANFRIWDKKWTWPKKPDGADADWMTIADADSDSVVVYVPAVFPYPNAAAHPSGKIGVVWINDVDSDAERVEPQVYFAERTSGNWPAVPVTTDPMFKCYASFAYLPDGTPLAVWVQASYDSSQIDSLWTLSQVLDRQDLWYAVRDGDSWTRAAVLTEQGGVHRADGVPAMASTEDGAVLVWARAAEGMSALDTGSSEVYFSKFSTDSWSTPLALTSNGLDDTSPAVCSTGGDTTVVLWLSEGAASPNTLVWRMWDGSTWRNAETLSGGGWTKHPPAVTRTHDGGALAVWVETELALPDSVRVYHLRSATLDPRMATWSLIQDVFVDSLLIETPIAIVDQRSIAVVNWRGYNGMDGDLWYSSKDLDDIGAPWTSPRLVTDDSLTDWMSTAAVDENNNVHFFDLKSDLAHPAEMTSKPTNFPGGLTLVSRGLSNTLELMEGLNVGYRPLTCDLWLGKGSVSIDDEMPAVGNSVPLSAVVKNIGDEDSPAHCLVHFYDAHPDSGGNALPGGTLELPVLAPDDSATVQAEWLVTAGSHRLYAVVDTTTTLGEQSNSNNTAYVRVDVVPDLAVDSVRVANVAPEPGATDSVLAFVRNAGGAAVNGFTVRFDDNAGTLGTRTGTAIAPAGTMRIALPFTATLGIHQLQATVDPDSLLTDPNRSNNHGSRALVVLPDLGIPFDAFTFDPTQLRLPALENVGSWDFWGSSSSTTWVTARLYVGNPRDGGVQLGPDVRVPILPHVCSPVPPYTCVGGLPPGESIPIPPIPWDTVAATLRALGIPLDLSGVPQDPITLYLVIDPEGEFPDRDKANNVATLQIGKGAPELTVAAGSIGFRYESVAADTLYARIVNRGSALSLAVPVEFFHGDPDSGGTLIADRLVPALAARDTALVQVAWDAPPEFTVFVVVDGANRIDERDETDNRDSRLFDTTPVVVSEFAAAMTGPTVTLTWRVDSVDGVTGLRVHRRVADGTLVPLTEQPLPVELGKMTFEDAAVGVAPSAHLTYRLEAVSRSGEREIIGMAVSIEFAPPLPTQCALHQNIPNPFNPVTVIRFDLARDGLVKLRIYDLAGRRVRTLRNGPMRAGWNHQVQWNGLDDRGLRVASGVYFYRLEADAYTATRKMLLIR